MTDMGDCGFYLCQDVSDANYIRKEKKSKEQLSKAWLERKLAQG